MSYPGRRCEDSSAHTNPLTTFGRIPHPTGATSYNVTVGFKAGVLVGIGIGYWFGAKAGEERYRQLEAMAERLRASDAYQSARDRARERLGTAVDDGVARARDMLNSATDAATDPSLGEFYDQDLDR